MLELCADWRRRLGQFSFLLLVLPPSWWHADQRTCPKQFVPAWGRSCFNSGSTFYDKLTDHDVTQVQVIDHDLCNAHEDLFTLHPPVVTCK